MSSSIMEVLEHRKFRKAKETITQVPLTQFYGMQYFTAGLSCGCCYEYFRWLAVSTTMMFGSNT